MTNKKITKATFKSFLKKHEGRLFLKVKSTFDGMTDCCEEVKHNFTLLEKTERHLQNTLGYSGFWLVGQSRDYFQSHNEDGFDGIEVMNCCGRFIVGVKK